MSRKKSKSILSLILIVVVLLFGARQVAVNYFSDDVSSNVFSATVTPAENEVTLSAFFLDVGQADCELFTLPDGKILLVDSGERGDGEKLVDHLKNLGISKIDYLLATHPHSDHIGGMSDVIDSFEIGKIFAPKVAANDVPTSKTYEDFLNSVKNKNLKITKAAAGSTLFEGENYKAECFAPCGSDYDGLNNYSAVVKITFGIHSFLLTGDAEYISEKEMLSAGYNLDCDILKVGHHGSSSSSSEDFLKKASPKYAVISCGADNSYGHPHEETLTALKNLKGLDTVFRTDKDKTITFTVDGKTENGITFKTNLASVTN